MTMMPIMTMKVETQTVSRIEKRVFLAMSHVKLESDVCSLAVYVCVCAVNDACQRDVNVNVSNKSDPFAPAVSLAMPVNEAMPMQPIKNEARWRDFLFGECVRASVLICVDDIFCSTRFDEIGVCVCSGGVLGECDCVDGVVCIVTGVGGGASV